jgi:hypothetical protein
MLFKRRAIEQDNNNKKKRKKELHTHTDTFKKLREKCARMMKNKKKERIR